MDAGEKNEREKKGELGKVQVFSSTGENFGKRS